jgi:hypothetical protein
MTGMSFRLSAPIMRRRVLIRLSSQPTANVIDVQGRTSALVRGFETQGLNLDVSHSTNRFD